MIAPRTRIKKAPQRRRIGTTKLPEMDSLGNWKRPGVDHTIAEADKAARTGHKTEIVRNTPPAGAWNDVADD